MLAVPWILKRRQAVWAHFFATQYVILGPFLARLVGARPLVTVTGLGRAFESSGGRKQGFYRRLYTCLFRMNARLSECLLFQNPADMERLRALLPHHLRHKCHLIGSAIDDSYFRAVACSGDEEASNILMVARLIPAKGIRDFISAAERLASESNPFVLVGPSSEHHPDLLAEVQRAEERGLLRYLGPQSDSVVREMYRKSRVVVLPSRSEGLPRVVLEATLSGRPVVAYSIPGCQAILPMEQLIPPFDSDDFVRRIDVLIASPRERENAVRMAKARVFEGFSVEEYTRRLEAHLKRIAPDIESSAGIGREYS